MADATRDALDEFYKNLYKRTRTTGRAGGGNRPWSRPMKSDALAVHPEQIDEAMARNKKHGITGVTYDPVDGRAIISDRNQRKRLMALEGVHDKNGGYGDDHAGQSPLYRQDSVPFFDSEM